MDSNRFLSYVQEKHLGRRRFLQGVGYTGIALAGGSLIAACGDQQSSSGPAPKGTKVSGTLSLAYMGTADQQKVWNQLFALFQ